MKTTIHAHAYAAAIVSLLLMASWASAEQADSAPGPLYIIFDASNSMWGELQDGARKITVARQVFNSLDPALFKGRELALRMYGHRRVGDCSDTELVVPFGPSGKILDTVAELINAVKPRGKTPIARSLTSALADFNDKAGDILLISDGIETCDADPCELVRSWRESGVRIRVHVVGLGLNEMSRSAMQCIANESGTRYMDATTAGELAIAIETTAEARPVEPGSGDPQPEASGPEFRVYGEDEDGRYLPVQGALYRDGMLVAEVASNGRFVIEGGEYILKAGVPTVNGELFEPVSRRIEVKSSGTTSIRLKLRRPPVIRTRFVEREREIRGVLARAYQRDREVFQLRPEEDYFVMPGSYRFIAALNKDNQLETTATILAGDDKDILFQADETVRVIFHVYPEGSNKRLDSHQELWQDGEMKYKVHKNNGATVRPGLYTLRSDDVLTGYEIKNVRIGHDKNQEIRLFVPLGAARIKYAFIAEPKHPARRCWLYKVDEQGRRVSARSPMQTCDGREIPLAAGRYAVTGWTKLGSFKDTRFSVEPGEVADVVLQQD